MTPPVGSKTGLKGHAPQTALSARLVVFRCANSEQPNVGSPLAAGRSLPQTKVDWPVRVDEVVVPCSGKLQPEHLLKAFEAGADGVCVLACSEDGCHYLEGSQRLSRRAEYVSALLDEVGLGGERLMVFHLFSPANDDMTPAGPLTDGSRHRQVDHEEFCSRLAVTSNEIATRFEALQPNPLREVLTTA